MVICEDGYCKLTDFGISQALDEKGEYKGRSGTPGYMPPETLARKGIQGPYSDFFGAGVTLCRMVAEKGPFHAEKHQRYANKGEDWQSVKMPKRREHEWVGDSGEVSDDMKALIEGLIILDPQKRWGGAKVRESLVYAGYDWAGLQAKKLKPPFIPDCSKANCELNEEDLAAYEGDEEETADDKYGAVTQDEQQLFANYNWNVTVADLNAGKRQAGTLNLKPLKNKDAPGVEQKGEPSAS